MNLSGSAGGLEYLTTGQGRPHTIFAHGLAGSIATTRPFGSGVTGAKTFLHFPGHGGSPVPARRVDYGVLAAGLRAVADEVGADQALGVSMGAGAVCRELSRQPDRWQRLVFVLPALIDRPRADEAYRSLSSLGRLVDAGDAAGIAAHLLRHEPPQVRLSPAARQWASGQAQSLIGTGLARVVEALTHDIPVPRRGDLATVTAPALVIGQLEDPLHPDQVARDLAAAMPNAQLEVLPPGGILWTHRDRVRGLIAEFLSSATDAGERAVAEPGRG